MGNLPLANTLLCKDALSDDEERYPLDIVLCTECSLVQLSNEISPQVLCNVDDSQCVSCSSTMMENAACLAEELRLARGLNKSSLVIEIGSSDGYFLRALGASGVGVLGIEPASGPAQAALISGLPTIVDFFGHEMAVDLHSKGLVADVIVARNVLAQVPDLNGFVRGIRCLLSPSGIAVVEVPYVRDMVNNCEIDKVFHENLSYFSVTSLYSLFRRHGLHVNDVELLQHQGGSIRIHVGHVEATRESVFALLDQEERLGISSPAYYERLSASARRLGYNLVTLLRAIKSTGMTIVAYGATPQAATLLNYCGIGGDIIEYAIDKNTHKQGKLIPGARILIRDPRWLLRDLPDYVLILPWHIKNEIIEQLREFRESGGRFIVPVPRIEVV